MLATGINTEIGVRVLGANLNDVVSTSEEIAAVLRSVPGAADVIADPIRGKGYLEIVPNREQMAEHGVDPRDLWSVIETSLGGQPVATVLTGRERHDVRVRAVRDATRDELAVRQLPVPCRLPAAHAARVRYVSLADVADVRIAEEPATIKSENGLLRNYVRLNVRGRGTFDFLADAQRAVAEEIALPEGTFLEWTGQFEHAEETARTLRFITPLVLGLILWILWLTYRDWADAGLMLLAVPGAIAGGVFFQWLFGFRWSVPVAVGYLACFGMATSTGIIMLVYLREALAKRGPLASLTEADLRAAVIEGAVHRLRPKLLTEGTTILGLAPMLWASGVGAEVIRPMAAPVLGGILIADEVIDLFLPVLFYWVRRRRWQRTQQSPSPTDEPSTKLDQSLPERNLEPCSAS
jgi:Cu(I)/Ag(I) efflux system membrane protein CusA/SilA